jgi:hypothetical protein
LDPDQAPHDPTPPRNPNPRGSWTPKNGGKPPRKRTNTKFEPPGHRHQEPQEPGAGERERNEEAHRSRACSAAEASIRGPPSPSAVDPAAICAAAAGVGGGGGGGSPLPPLGLGFSGSIGWGECEFGSGREGKGGEGGRVFSFLYPFGMREKGGGAEERRREERENGWIWEGFKFRTAPLLPSWSVRFRSVRGLLPTCSLNAKWSW